jgi:hypothetical protein
MRTSCRIGLLFLSFCSTTCLTAQPRARQTEAFAVNECEGKVCSPGSPGNPTWTFAGLKGTGRFGTGEQPLTIEHIDRDSIAVRRVDVTGPARGLKALYLGKIEGQRITGSVIYYDPRRPDQPNTDAWYGIIQGLPDGAEKVFASKPAPAPSMPLTVKECESDRCMQQGAVFPIVWKFISRQGTARFGTGDQPVTIEHIDGGFIAVRRVDTTGPAQGLTALYLGQIDGKRITGSVLYYDRAHPSVPNTDTWFGVIQDSGSVQASGRSDVTVRPEGPDRCAGTAKCSDVPQSGSSADASMPLKSPEGYPPPPPEIPAVIGNRHKIINLNGDWEGYYASPGTPTAIRIRHNGAHIESELLHDDLTGTGTMFFKGDFDPGTTFAHVQVLDMNGLSAFTGVTGGSYRTDMFGTIDFDHVAIANHPPFQRISLPSYNDIPCSSANETGVKAKWAYMRAVVAQRAKDLPAAVCWLYVAAVQGDATAQFYLAYFIHEGAGTERNAVESIKWATKGAENGSDLGAYMLAKLYTQGDGTSADPDKARYWRDRGDALKIQRQKEAAAEKAQEQQQRLGMLELGAIGVLGAALLADEMMPDPLCDYSNDSKQDRAEKRRKLNELGEECSGLTAHPVRR